MSGPVMFGRSSPARIFSLDSPIASAAWTKSRSTISSEAPRVARVTRGASLEIVERDFVQAAEAMGESRLKILAGELLPNITGPLMVEASLRLTYSIGLIAGLSFLGFGLQPPN